MVSTATAGPTELDRAQRRGQQRAWNWYDWANSAYYTTVLTVLFAPYMITVAGRAAGCTDPDATCSRTVSVLGLHLAAGSLPSYLTSFATISSAFVLPVVGAFVDRSSRKKWHMAGYAYTGAFFAGLLFLLHGTSWQLAAVAIVLSSILAGCSLVCYYAILVDISNEDERDRVSSHGWAWGYLGGGLLLALNLVVYLGHDRFGLDEAMSVRVSLLSAAVWWAAFTLIPLRRLRNQPPQRLVVHDGRTLVQRSFGQLLATLREARRYPMTMTFLLAYLFYNDGIQTVIYAASVYGEKELGFPKSTVLLAFLVVQLVGIGGALGFGRLAGGRGAYRVVLTGLFVWLVVVVAGWLVPRDNLPAFFALAVAIGIVLGGTQALSRSFFSQLIPRGREAEYFSLYQACERGTSWIGTLVFGLVHQWTDSYRPALLALVVLFVIGIAFLVRVNPRRGIEEAGNPLPSVV